MSGSQGQECCDECVPVPRRGESGETLAARGKRPGSGRDQAFPDGVADEAGDVVDIQLLHQDRKSTRLNSSHLVISYAVFCLKKKKKNDRTSTFRPQSTPII